ncbi:histidine kinase dimerization/phosphoacceptor domain -containing protein [Mucilaginibacter celer]|uniref:histidine kinase n=1 Tax=Mucilaginibacter celer TaxID=2305508 RepID=A0A494VWK8_9SPHI|nr:histidine kinase dimerization/phosphoacceptor domain -containing protein [Mucilaginibacter celer]AYL95372.1 hypothetical protein HYN43_008735 [Mucilaginibacter celer]
MKISKIFICWIISQLLLVSAYGQDVTGNLTANEANHLLLLLKKSPQDSAKFNLLLQLAQYNILKPGELKVDLDNAADFINQAKRLNKRLLNDESEGYILLVQSMLVKERGDKKRGLELAEQAVSRLKKVSFSHHLGDAYIELSTYYTYFIQEQLNKKIQIVELGVSALKREGKILKLAYSQQLLADLYTNNAAQAKALGVLNSSLANYKAVHYKSLQGVYIIYSTAYSLMSDYKMSLKYGLLALRTAEELQDTTMQRCEINNILGVILVKMKEYEKSIEYFKNALQIAERYDDRNSILLVISNTVTAYNSLKKYKESLHFIKGIPLRYLNTKDPAFSSVISYIYCSIYISLKLYPEAKPYAERLSLIVTNQPNMIANINNAYLVLIKYYTATKQYSAARKYLNSGMAKIKSNGGEVPLQMQRYYGLSFKLDSAVGNYKSAIENILKFNKLKDSIFNQTKTKQLKQLEIEYETEKKASEIKILHQKAVIQQEAYQKVSLLKNITLGGILVLFAFICLLYRQYRSKQKSNRIVNLKNFQISEKNKLLEHLLKEKEWLLKEVHHRVKNNLHTVICLLESQALYLENDALKAIENSQHRIYAMSLIHQKLYQAEDVKTIDMSIYLPEFIQYLNESFGTQRQVRFHLEIEPIQLGVSQAIPLALIINEAVTNSIKYAFTPDVIGIISVSMSQHGQEITLIVADNGIGLDPTITNMPSESLGLKLMNGLSEDINAHIFFENYNGTRITILFNVDPLNNEHHFSGTLNQE